MSRVTIRTAVSIPAVSILICLLTGCGDRSVQIQSATIQIGWYTSERESVSRLIRHAHAGATLMIGYHAGEPYTSRWLRGAAVAGVRVLLQPDPSWVIRGNADALRTFVRRYQHAPAIGGWYLFDEPDREDLPPRRLVSAYRAIKSLDQRPVEVAFMSGQCRFGRDAIDPAYLKGLDGMMFVRYPFYADITVADPVGDIRRVTRACVQSAHAYDKLPPIMVLQGFGKGQHDGPFLWRDPTYGESLAGARAALAAGAGGVLFWNDTHADQEVLKNTDRVLGFLHRHPQIWAICTGTIGSRHDSCPYR